MSSSRIERWTMRRLKEVQRCPAVPTAENRIARTAMSRSAEGATIMALLPPSSRMARPNRAATFGPTTDPIRVEPVAETIGTSLEATSASPIAGPPMTTCASPSGASAPKRLAARSNAFIAASALSGVFSDGFQIIGSPHTSARAAFHDHTATGKLNAEMTAHGPIGCQMRSVGMPRHMPFEHVDQGQRFGRRRDGRQSLSRRLNANSLLRRKGAVQRLRQIMDGFSLANGLREQPHPERPLNTKDQFGSSQTVDPQVLLDLAGWANVDESGTLRMQLPRQSRDDRDHVAFVRTLVRRRTDSIGLPRHRSDYKNSERRRFAVDQTAVTVILRPAPPNQLRGRVPIRRPPSTAPDPQEIAG